LSLTKVQELSKKLAPIIGETKSKKFVKMHILEDLKGKRDIEQKLELMTHKLLPDDSLNLVPPYSTTAKGKYPIGNINYAGKPLHIFGLRKNELSKHVLITGDTGAGKTNLILLLIANLLVDDVRFWIFDRKGNFRDILRAKTKSDILVFTPGTDVSPFYFNPNQPIEGIDPETILKLDIDNLEAFYVGEGVKSLLLKAKHSNYEKFGLYSGTSKTLPTPADDLEELKTLNLKRRKLDWFQSAERTMDALSFGKMGKMLNVRQCPDITGLTKRSIIFEMLHLSKVETKYFTSAILTRIYLWKKVATQKGDNSQLVIIIDEAHYLFLDKSGSGDECITDIILREGRSIGLHLIIGDQFCHLLSKRVFGCYTKIAFSSGSRADMNLISSEWLLDEDEKEWLPKLKTGECIVKLKDRYPTPFLVKVKLMQKGKPISDEMIRQRMQGFRMFQELSEVPQVPGADEKTNGKEHRIGNDKEISGQIGPSPQIPPSNQQVNQKKPQIPQVPSPNKGEKVDEDHGLFLIDVRKNPFSGIKKRFERIKVGKNRGYKIIENLKEKGYIRSHAIRNKRSKIVLIEPTALADQYLDSKNIKPILSSARRHGDIVHQYLIDKVAKYRKFLGHTKIDKEYPIGSGKSVDVCSLDKDGNIVFDEIDKETETAIRNIRKCLECQSKNLLSEKIKLYVWMIEKAAFLKLSKKIKKNGWDKKIQLTVFYVRDHF
jgi:hypothetical protein